MVAFECADRVDRRPVVEVVELLHDLERPAAVEHVASDDLVAYRVGVDRLPALFEQVGGRAELEVGVSHQLMERVQVPPGALDVLERLRGLADRLDQRVIRCRHRPTIAQPTIVHDSCHPRRGAWDLVITRPDGR